MAEMPILGGEESEAEQQFEANATAIAMALDGAKADPRLTGPITEFLAEQRALIAEQRHHLGEQLKRLRLGILDQRMSIVLKVMTAAIGLVIAVGLGAAIWYAAHDNGLVIEAFSVPPDMAQRGLTGQAVAAQLLDKLADMQAATESARPAGSYTNNWGDDIKVQIPETGVSIGQFYGLLVTWLGRQTHITGEVFRTANGLAIAARGGGDGGAMVAGSEADLDKLLQQTAETIYKRTQPYRYAVYLNAKRHAVAESDAIFESLAATGPARERAWAYNGLGTSKSRKADFTGALADLRQAVALDPLLGVAYANIGFEEMWQGHDEAALTALRQAVEVMSRRDADMSERARTALLPLSQSNLAVALGDFATSSRISEQAAGSPDFNFVVERARDAAAISLARLHESTAARRAWNTTGFISPLVRGYHAENRAALDDALEDWPDLAGRMAQIEQAMAENVQATSASPAFTPARLSRTAWPHIAVAMAKLGDFIGAHALIDQTPPDCGLCQRSRGRIDAEEKNWGGAEYWFARAVREAPSIPFAYTDWGAMLMAKGDLDGAIAKFKIANDKGPHFADPLEIWGEALIAKNRSDLALAKFAEADKYAPNWGRVHLKWGEALLWTGDKDGAAKQFAIAAHLDLSPAEKSELARMRAAHG